MAEELEHALKAVRDLSKTLKGLPMDPPPKEVHRLRTATRRVEAILSVLAQNESKESRRVLQSIDLIRKAAGGVRDMDVLIGHARKLTRYAAGDSLARLIEQLQIARQQNAIGLRRALSRARDKAREDLKEYSLRIRSALKHANGAVSANGSPAETGAGIHSAASTIVREMNDWPPLDAENIHAFRLKVKTLRYTLQLSADANSGLADVLGDVQRRIGDWHDWQQLNEIAREILNPRRDAPLLTRVEQTCSQKLRRALAAANRLRAKYLSMPIAQGI